MKLGTSRQKNFLQNVISFDWIKIFTVGCPQRCIQKVSNAGIPVSATKLSPQTKEKITQKTVT